MAAARGRCWAGLAPLVLAVACGAPGPGSEAEARGADASVARDAPDSGAHWELVGAPVVMPGARYTGLAVAADGAPLLIHDTYGDDRNATYVERFDSAWAPLGGPLRALSAAGGQTGTPAVARDGAGRAVAAWAEYDPARFQLDLRVAVQDGAGWRPLGGALDAAPGAHADAYFPALAVGPGDQPVVAWSEAENPTPYAFRIHVARWDGAAWQLLGGPLSVNPRQGAGHLRPVVRVDREGAPLVAWAESDGAAMRPHLARWDGQAWQPVGDDALAKASVVGPRVSLALDAAGQPVLAWRGRGGAHPAIFVLRWDGHAWSQVATPLAQEADDVLGAEVLCAGGPLMVAWLELAGGRARARAAWLEGGAWQALSEPLAVEDTLATDLHAAVSAEGLPVISWFSDGPRPQLGHVARLRR